MIGPKLSARHQRSLSNKRWRVVSVSVVERGENGYFPQYLARRWFWPLPRWNYVGDPAGIGFLGFLTNDAAIAFCEQLSPVSVSGSGVAKRTWEPPIRRSDADDGFSAGVVAGVVGLGLLS